LEDAGEGGSELVGYGGGASSPPSDNHVEPHDRDNIAPDVVEDHRGDDTHGAVKGHADATIDDRNREV
jgi:hypothetical protein